MKKALITGVAGQDGSYLAELLIEKGYDVHGTIRRNSSPENQTTRLENIFHLQRLTLHYSDVLDMSSLIKIIKDVMPDEIYHLAAQSHVGISFQNPIYTCDVDAMGTLNLLEAVRLIKPDTKIYNAGTSEMFGNKFDLDLYQREDTPMSPVSPYGCAKVFSYNIMRNYRNSYGMFLSNGILFNHESPKRGINFVTNKVCKAAVDIYRGNQEKLHLGNLESSRDWSHAKDMVRAMWLILQAPYSDDYVCASGVSHTVRELCEYVFNKLGMDYKNYVISDEKFMRPEELNYLRGDSTKLRTKLGWEPTYTFETMLDEMIDHWLKATEKAATHVTVRL